MFKKKDLEKISFKSVGMALIILGAAVLAYGAAGWLINFFGASCVVVFPSLKVMGGAVIIGFGYIILELELLRLKS